MKVPAISPNTTHRHLLVLGVILLVALGLRLYGLDQHNIWWDEGLSAWAARLSVGHILDWTAHDVHPPLYFLIQRGWWLLTGDGEWPMRFISALSGTGAVAAVYLLAKALGGRRAGLLAAAFLALSGFAVTWSQELRMYVWASLWAPLALYAALKTWQAHAVGDRRALIGPWLLYVFAAAAGLWTLYLFVTVLIVANLAFLVFLARAERRAALLARWVPAQVAVLALFAPWLAYALPRMTSWSSSEPFSPAFFARLYTTVLTTGIAENVEPWLIPALLVLAIFVAGVVGLSIAKRTRLQTAGLVMLLLGVLLPGLMVYALTALPGRSFYVPRLAPRYFLPLAGTFYALLGWGCVELARRVRWVGALAPELVMTVAVAGLISLLPGRVASDQYVSLVDTLRAYEHPGDRVLLYPDEDWPLFAARYPGPWEKVPAGMDLTAENVPGLLEPAWQAAEGLWVVTTAKAQETDPKGLVAAWLNGHAQSHDEWDFGETKLAFYPRTAERANNRNELYEFGRNATSRRYDEWFAGEFGVGVFVPLRRYRAGDTLHLAVYHMHIPEQQVTCLLRGPSPREFVMPEPKEARGWVRSLAHLPLTPDMKPGRYEVYLRDGAGKEIHAGGFDLVAAHAGMIGQVSPQQPLDLRLGEHVRLIGYDLPQQAVGPGEFVSLTLYWQTDSVLTERYKVFAHLIGTVWNAEQGNFLWGQQDNEPQADQLPTTRWVPAEVVVDRYRVKLDPKAPAGSYQVEVGMYGLLDGARLKFRDGSDAFVLGQVQGR